MAKILNMLDIWRTASSSPLAMVDSDIQSDDDVWLKCVCTLGSCSVVHCAPGFIGTEGGYC